MIEFTTTILKFDDKGEKTNWTYILIPFATAQLLKPGNKKSFRVKGKLDAFSFNDIALIPLGGGEFVMPLNASIRKNIGKGKGDRVLIQLQAIDTERKLSAELMECLQDEPAALSFFNSLSPSHRNYFSNWINSAKGAVTKSSRIDNSITALLKGYNFGEMVRSLKNNKVK